MSRRHPDVEPRRAAHREEVAYAAFRTLEKPEHVWRARCQHGCLHAGVAIVHGKRCQYVAPVMTTRSLAALAGIRSKIRGRLRVEGSGDLGSHAGCKHLLIPTSAIDWENGEIDMSQSITTPKDGGRQWISMTEAAEILGVSTKTIRRRITDGTIPAYRLGPRNIRIDVTELKAALRIVETPE